MAFGNADAVGWMFLRNDIGNKEKIVSAAEKSLNGLLKYHTKRQLCLQLRKRNMDGYGTLQMTQEKG